MNGIKLYFINHLLKVLKLYGGHINLLFGAAEPTQVKYNSGVQAPP
jgi:hypothetical protein